VRFAPRVPCVALWHNARFKALRAALPAIVPRASLAAAASLLADALGEELAPSLRRASVHDAMCARAAGGAAALNGVLMHDVCTRTGLQEDAVL
jgi:hypothetical protein